MDLKNNYDVEGFLYFFKNKNKRKRGFKKQKELIKRVKESLGDAALESEIELFIRLYFDKFVEVLLKGESVPIPHIFKKVKIHVTKNNRIKFKTESCLEIEQEYEILDW